MSSLLNMSEDQLRCSICLDIFVEPVSTPCGHNFCKRCLGTFWATRDPICPICKQTFKTQPELRVNTLVAEIIAQFKIAPHISPLKEEGSMGESDAVDSGATDRWVQQMIQVRLKKVEEIKHSVELRRASSEKEIGVSEQVFTALLSSIQRAQADVIGGVVEKQKAVETQAEGLIQELEQEVTDLEGGNANAGLRVIPPLAWSEGGPASEVSFIRTVVSRLEDTFTEEMKKAMDTGLKELKRYAVDVDLDPDTANNFLSVSKDGKQVRHVHEWINLSYHPKRFNKSISVLGTRGFSSGRFYFLVQVTGKTDWGVGVAKESVNRKGKITPRPEIGYWTVWLARGHGYLAADSSNVLLPLREQPQKVGVFVDYKEGLVSFYDVEARVHIYSFTGCTFSEELYPFLCSTVNDDDQNSAPFIILPVSQRG